MLAAVGALEADEAELSAHLATNARVFEAAKVLRARIKERKEIVCDIMNETNLYEYVAGNRVFTRTTAPKILVNKKRVESHMGAAASYCARLSCVWNGVGALHSRCPCPSCSVTATCTPYEVPGARLV